MTQRLQKARAKKKRQKEGKKRNKRTESSNLWRSRLLGFKTFV